MEYITSALLGSTYRLDETMNTLKRKLQVLESKEHDVKEELKQLEYNCSTKKPRKEVQNWLTEVERIKTGVQQLKEQEVQERRFWRRNPQLQKNVDKLTTETTELIEQSKFPRGIALESYEREGVALLTKRLLGETFERNRKQIYDYVVAGEGSIIGVYGMGGVGKTTLVTHIHNQLLNYRGINYVLWVTVSRDFSIRKLQQDIARAIQLDISKEDDERKRAALLARAFHKMKNFVLILDDVWDNISLEKVGICIDENGCKLILTTRSFEVCRMMNCCKKIKVDPLSDAEAWTLFVKTLGHETLLTGQIEGLAKSLVEECDGLPLGIIVVAGSMRGQDDIHEWSNALEEIKDAKYRNDDMEFYDVFCILKHSYDRLKDPKVQECLLYCSLFPEDELIEREQLIEYFIDEELIDGTMNRTRQSKIDKGHTILNKLENVCLLESQSNIDGRRCVKMHDLIRDMAIKIARVSHRFLVKSGMQLNNIPNDEEWSEDLVRVSLRSNNIHSIPFYSSPPKCPKLLTLLLCGNHPLKVIPRLFFMHMKLLTILDLSDTSIDRLPSSISNLESLTALLLRGCRKLIFVPYLENLTALRRLDLGWTAIEEAPKGLEKLINLRYLNFFGCENLKLIPDGVLSKLSHIEYFKSAPTPTLSGEEIGSWKRLETFHGRFDQVSDLNSCIRLWEGKEPKYYTIHLRYEYDFLILDFLREVILKKLPVGAEDKFVLPRSTRQLQLQECHGMTSLSHTAALKKVPHLRTCRVYRCNSIRHVICSFCNNILFSQRLKFLELEDLPMLSDLVGRERNLPSSSSSSVLPTTTFSSLKKLVVKRCHGLKRMFTPTQLSHLRSLERCEVWNCRQLVEIIGEASDEDENKEASTTVISMPPRFQTLELYDLPELKSLCNSSIKLSDSLKELSIFRCPRLTRITLLWEEHSHPSLKHLSVQKEWWDSVQWKHPKTKDTLQPFVKFH